MAIPTFTANVTPSIVDLVGDSRQHRRIADVGVDLDQEVAADRHRLQLAVVDVGRDDGSAARHFLAHELGGHEVGNAGAEILAVADARAILLAELATNFYFRCRR